MDVRLIGCWKSEVNPAWPDVRDFIDLEWDDGERDEVLWYTKSGTTARAFMEPSMCRLCGTRNGSAEDTDGTYIWPEGLAHYIEAHGVRLPAEFVRHDHSRFEELDEIVVDAEWWQAQHHP
jgi:hypothetical protein